ncbi:MAG: hypothetical protein ABJL67_09440 [Sulfitobacter sp.]
MREIGKHDHVAHMIEPPSIYDIASTFLGGGALWLSYQRFKDGRRRVPPKFEAFSKPIDGGGSWRKIGFHIENRESTPIVLEAIRVPLWSRTRLLNPDWPEKTDPWQPEENALVGLKEHAHKAGRRLIFETDISRQGHYSKSLFIFREARTIIPMFRWADSTSTFSLKIKID